MNTQSNASSWPSSESDANTEWHDKAHETSKTEQVKQAAQETASIAAREIKQTAGIVAKEAKQSLGEVAAQTKEQAAELTEQVKQQAGEKIDAQKSQAAERLGGVASALRETGRTLHEREDDTVAQYVDSLAGQVEKASTYLKEMNISDMAREIQNFAQRKPEMFLLTSLAAGFLLGRFLRSSSDNTTSPTYAGSNGGSYGRDSYPNAYHAGSSETSQRAYTPDPTSVYSASE
jgi:hypothetical protein